MKYLKVAGWGLLVSFLGSLPLGTMNVAATHISLEQGSAAGMMYALGSMVVEIIVVRIALVAMDWLVKRHRLFRILELFTTGLLLVLAVASMIAAIRMTGFTSSVPVAKLNPFLTGALLSVTNPLHIPFWMGWTTVLMNKEILQPEPKQYNWYIAGIGIGTVAGFAVFVFAGSYFISQLSGHQDMVNWVIGIVLLFTFLIQLKKIISTPASVRYARLLR